MDFIDLLFIGSLGLLIICTVIIGVRMVLGDQEKRKGKKKTHTLDRALQEIRPKLKKSSG